MNGNKEDSKGSFCCFHPHEALVGVCPFCLNDRLLVLAANLQQQRRRPVPPSHQSDDSTFAGYTYRSQSVKHRIFALGSSLLHRSHHHHHHRHRHRHSDTDDDTSATSRDESFISIKFEDNGVASWEKGTVSKVCLDNCKVSWMGKETKQQQEAANKSVIEHAKPSGSLRWRKRIGHLFQLSRWNRSSKASGCHVGSKQLEGVKVRSGWWIRSLTKRRPKE